MAAGRRKRRVRGDRSFKKLIKRLPDVIREEMVTTLEHGGDEILAAMQADAPERTGAVKRALTRRVLRGALQLKVGLVGRPINRRLFYARIVEKGRKAQTVIVSRSGAHRAAGGRVAGRRARALQARIKGVYEMRVPAMAPRPFIYSQRVKKIRETMGGALNTFWTRVLQRAAQGATDE